jgi:hypothetical protein
VIVLDTNVVSEPLRRSPDSAVLAWLAESADALALTAVSVGELLYGARLLPEGRRRAALVETIEDVLDSFPGLILSYDDEAARSYAELSEAGRKAGRPVSVEDRMIAGICLSQGATLATRNVKHFVGLGIDLVNPWDAASPSE